MKNIYNKKQLKKIAEDYGINLLVLFGSRATGTARASSDFDIAYRASSNLSLEKEAKLMLDLSKSVKSETIDLVNIIVAPPLLRYAIFKNGIPLYEKTPLTFSSMNSYAYKQFVEMQPLFEERVRRVKEKIQSYDI